MAQFQDKILNEKPNKSKNANLKSVEMPLEYLAPFRFIFNRKRTSIVIWDLGGSEKWKHSCPILLSSGRMRQKKPNYLKHL